MTKDLFVTKFSQNGRKRTQSGRFQNNRTVGADHAGAIGFGQRIPAVIALVDTVPGLIGVVPSISEDTLVNAVTAVISALTTVNGKNVYGDFSAAKSVKIK